VNESDDPKWGRCECPNCRGSTVVRIPFTGNYQPMKNVFHCQKCHTLTPLTVITQSRMNLLQPFSEARNDRINKQNQAAALIGMAGRILDTIPERA